MTGTTPLYGIRYPDSATKLVGLGSELATFAGDVERVLQSVNIPPAAPAPVVVAATAAARDQTFGVPSTDTQRRNLQNLGATVIRTDKGWTERYFAQWHATNNPGGAATPGWYPIDGAVPFGRLVKTNNFQAPTTSGVVVDGMELAATTGGVTRNGNRLVLPVAGIYRVTIKPYTSSGQAGSLTVGVNTGSQAAPNAGEGPTVVIVKGGNDTSPGSVSADFAYAAGTQLAMAMQANDGLTNVWGNGSAHGTYLEARYLSPRQG